MIKIIGPKDPKDPTAINTTSRSTDFGKGLSPFFLGPCNLYGNYVAKNVENGWQYSKVYPYHVGDDGNPTELYFMWAENGWNDSKAQRYPMGKGKKPAYSYWDGKKLSYVEARKEIYIPLYVNAVRPTQAFKTLSELHKTTKNVVLWDFDGYDHRKLEMTYDQVKQSETRKMGHAFVLAMMLENLL